MLIEQKTKEGRRIETRRAGVAPLMRPMQQPKYTQRESTMKTPYWEEWALAATVRRSQAAKLNPIFQHATLSPDMSTAEPRSHTR